MVYLGACYAAGGNDKEAAGARGPRSSRRGHGRGTCPPATRSCGEDKGDLALEALDDALAAGRGRWAETRFAVAALLSGKQADGLQAVDELLEEAGRGMSRLAAVLYDAFVGNQPIESAEQDRARIIRFGHAYRVQGDRRSRS